MEENNDYIKDIPVRDVPGACYFTCGYYEFDKVFSEELARWAVYIVATICFCSPILLMLVNGLSCFILFFFFPPGVVVAMITRQLMSIPMCFLGVFTKFPNIISQIYSWILSIANFLVILGSGFLWCLCVFSLHRTYYSRLDFSHISLEQLLYAGGFLLLCTVILGLSVFSIWKLIMFFFNR